MIKNNFIFCLSFSSLINVASSFIDAAKAVALIGGGSEVGDFDAVSEQQYHSYHHWTHPLVLFLI